MPTDAPHVGETWETSDPVTNQVHQAVICNTTPDVVTLISRLCRILHVPLRSFNLTWHFQHESLNRPCQRCGLQGVLRVPELVNQSWLWVCANHLPDGCRQALLPHDRNTPLSAPQDTGRCPNCNTQLRSTNSGALQVEDTNIVIHHCAECSREWALVYGRGDEIDGLYLAEQVIELAEVLSPRVTNIRALSGSTALASIRRAAGVTTTRTRGGTSVSTRLAGIPLQRSDRYGSNTVVVVGDPAIQSVPRIGGAGRREPLPGTVYVEGPPEHVGRMRPRQDLPILPAVGSLWVAILGGRRTVVRVEDTAPYEEDTEHMVRFSDQEDNIQALPVRMFLGRYRLENETDLVTSIPYAQDIVESVKPEDLEDPHPRISETWWHKKTTQPVFITAIEVDLEKGTHITFRGGINPSERLTQEAFLEQYEYSPTAPPCEPGEEWFGDGESVIIQEVVMERREVIVIKKNAETPRVKKNLSFPLFLGKYKKIERVSVYDRILGDDFEDEA